MQFLSIAGSTSQRVAGPIGVEHRSVWQGLKGWGLSISQHSIDRFRNIICSFGLYHYFQIIHLKTLHIAK